jgi:hypothetical protein
LTDSLARQRIFSKPGTVFSASPDLFADIDATKEVCGVCREKKISGTKNAPPMRKVNLSGGKNSVGITISNKAERKFIFS